MAFLLALGVMAVSAAACGSGGGAEPTTLSTSLSGESKEGETITVLEGSKIKDKATLSGTHASSATGKVTYDIYSESGCKTLVKAAGEVTVSGASVPASSEEELEGGASYYWQATYSGDSKNSGSTSTCGKEISTVKAKTALSTKLSGESKEGEELTVLEGSKVKDKATLSGANHSTAGGKVLYQIFSDSKCEHPVKEAGEETVTSGSVPASIEEELEGGASYYWEASYKGDSLHQESKSGCTEVSTVKVKTTLSTTLSGEGQSSEEIELQPEAEMTDAATVHGEHASSATGTVKYAIYSDSACKELYAEAGEATVTGGTALASTAEVLPAGTYYWQATYSGDAYHQSATSPCDKEIATVKPGTSLTTSLSGEGQEDDQVEIGEGVAMTDTATLSGADASMATGTIKYNVYSDNECKELVASAGEVIVSGGLAGPSVEETLPAGTYYWQAVYSGDSDNQAAKSACGSEIAVVRSGGWLTTSLSSEGHSIEESEVEKPLEVAEGAGVKDAAILHGENPSTATGTVTYKVYSDDECKELVTTAGEVTVTGGSIPASSEEALAAGTYYWQAVYSGDSEHKSAMSACGTETVIARTATSLSTSLTGEGMSGAEISVSEATEVTDQATLSGTHASTAGGSVEYNAYSDSECKTLAADAGSVNVTSGSVPASDLVSLPAGTYYWQATYSGDSENAASKSACGTEITVVRIATELSTSLSGEAQSGNTISVADEAGVKDEATLSGSKASTASGKVRYGVYSDSKCETLVVEAGEVTVSSGAVPASSEVKLSAGTYYWQATYSGDSENATSTSTCGSEIAVVKATSLTTSLSGEEESGRNIEVQEGAAAADHATLSSAHSSEATGKVKYAVYSDDKCEKLVTNAGEVSVSAGVVPPSTEETLSAGTYYWQAVYSGDGKNAASESLCGTEEQIVVPAPAATLTEVDFLKNQKVVLDYPVSAGRRLGMVGITEYPRRGQNEVEWKSANVQPGAKNWPIAYAKGKSMELEATFSPGALTRRLIANNGLESAKITGTMSVFGKALKVESAVFNNAALRAQIAAGGIKTGAITTGALPSEDGYQKMTITWEWTIRVKGVNLPAIALGTSTHNLYVTFKSPMPAGAPVFFTILDIAGKGGVSTARAPVATEAATIPKVWEGFTTKPVGPETPLTTVQRKYEPATGTISEGGTLKYWPEGPPGAGPPVGRTLAATLNLRVVNRELTLRGLLRAGQGQCSSWAAAFVAALGSEGITARTVELEPTVPANRSPNMLVKRWSFAVGGENTTAQVVREQGVPGQGWENPWAYFKVHYITLVENQGVNNNRELYDPSYGRGPIVFTSRRQGEVTLPALLEYQEGALAGNCADLPNQPVRAVRCEKLTVGMLSMSARVFAVG